MKCATKCLVVATLLANASMPVAPRVALMGGGADQDKAFQWMCEQTRGSFVILRATGTNAYDAYIQQLCPAIESIETLIIPSRQAAQEPSVADKIRHAQAVFIAGGSQDNYVKFWQGTLVEAAINADIRRGVTLGGTSAGLAVLGQYMFSALNDTIRSTEALRNPFDPRVTIGRDFLRVPHLEAKITDSHFVARDRMGRLIVFLARIASEGWNRTPYGIGIDEKTAVLMEPNGSASVVGQGAAYFLHAPGPAQGCSPNAPLTYRNISVYRVRAGIGRFNLAAWTGTGGTAYAISIERGVLTSTLEGNRIY